MFNSSKVVMADQNAVNVVPTTENVDFYRIYRYTDFVPTYGMFPEEKYKFDETYRDKLCKEMVEGRWVGNVEIKVDINTYNVSEHNHTYSAYVKAKELGFEKPLLVTYESVTNDKKSVLEHLLVDEWIKKFSPNGVLVALMGKDGEAPNSANKVYDYCMGHPYLKGSNKSFKLGMGFICLFGESKKYMAQLKKGFFNPRNTKVDYTSYDLLDKALEIRNMAVMNNPAGMESFLRKWYEFYTNPKNYSYLNTGGWDNFIANVKPVVNAMGGIETKQKDDYYGQFFEDLMLVTKGTRSIKDIKQRFGTAA